MNQVSFTGRITRDPELFYSKEGTGITKFHLAVKRNFKGSNGTYEADFIPCVAFRKTAENIASYCCRGSLIAVNGRLQSRSFEKKDHSKVYITEVVVDAVEFLERKKESNK